MAVKMKALRSDSLAATLSQAKRQAWFNRDRVRQHDWLRKHSGGYPAFGARPMGVI